jgi:hypothetical protein
MIGRGKYPHGDDVLFSIKEGSTTNVFF